jgi:DDE superfamily endonuclease
MQDVSSSRLVPASLALWMQPFREGFTAPTWEHVLVLIVGSILTPGRRTVAAALRVVGFEQAMEFANYHRVLNRNRWSSRWVARPRVRQMEDLARDGRYPPGPTSRRWLAPSWRLNGGIFFGRDRRFGTVRGGK